MAAFFWSCSFSVVLVTFATASSTNVVAIKNASRTTTSSASPPSHLIQNLARRFFLPRDYSASAQREVQELASRLKSREQDRERPAGGGEDAGSTSASAPLLLSGLSNNDLLEQRLGEELFVRAGIDDNFEQGVWDATRDSSAGAPRDSDVTTAPTTPSAVTQATFNQVDLSKKQQEGSTVVPSNEQPPLVDRPYLTPLECHRVAKVLLNAIQPAGILRVPLRAYQNIADPLVLKFIAKCMGGVVENAHLVPETCWSTCTLADVFLKRYANHDIEWGDDVVIPQMLAQLREHLRSWSHARENEKRSLLGIEDALVHPTTSSLPAKNPEQLSVQKIIDTAAWDASEQVRLTLLRLLFATLRTLSMEHRNGEYLFCLGEHVDPKLIENTMRTRLSRIWTLPEKLKHYELNRVTVGWGVANVLGNYQVCADSEDVAARQDSEDGGPVEPPKEDDPVHLEDSTTTPAAPAKKMSTKLQHHSHKLVYFDNRVWRRTDENLRAMDSNETLLEEMLQHSDKKETEDSKRWDLGWEQNDGAGAGAATSQSASKGTSSWIEKNSAATIASIVAATEEDEGEVDGGFAPTSLTSSTTLEQPLAASPPDNEVYFSVEARTAAEKNASR
ncbi:unnamed protein product, partial [Amoebophrya sp. A120]|eukprot:GSA120T00019757001.1